MHWNAKTFWSLRWNVLNWCFRHALKFCLLIQCVCSCSSAATHCGESDIQPMSSKQANNELLPLSLYCIGQEHKVRHEYPSVFSTSAVPLPDLLWTFRSRRNYCRKQFHLCCNLATALYIVKKKLLIVEHVHLQKHHYCHITLLSFLYPNITCMM